MIRRPPRSTLFPSRRSSDLAAEPKATWYFYTVKWGSQDEFLDLFQRNHYPVLKAKEKAGQYRSVRTLVPRSEEHTSELQSQSNLVCRLLLEKKKKILKNKIM